MKHRERCFDALLLSLVVFACQKPDPAAEYKRKGDELYSKGEYAKAANEYAESLKLNPAQSKLWQKKADAHLKAGNTDEAAATLLGELPQMTDPKAKAERYSIVANLYLNARQPDKAEKYFEEVIKLDPKDDLSLTWLGEIYSTKGGARAAKAPAVLADLEKAIGYYNQAIAANPSGWLPYVNKRIAMIKIAQYEQTEGEAALKESQDRKRTKAQIVDAKSRAEQHRARVEQLKQEIEELKLKIAELQKAAKAADAGARS
jgi:tetratricopeptide (TPR) repeat protein